MTIFEIKVYADTICAWCYIGHRNLHQAIAIFQKTYPGGSSDDFRVVYLPYYRDRTLPTQGIHLEDRLRQFSSEEEVEKLKQHVQRVGRSHGIGFKFDTIIGHTRDSQRLIYLAGLNGNVERQKAVVEQMYVRWHEIGGDITSHKFLLECATDAGMVEKEVRDVLESDKYGTEVDESDEAARAAGVSCVPTFVINGKAIQGAEDATAFYEVFMEAKTGDVDGV